MKFKIQNLPVNDLFSYKTIELTTGFYTVIGANGTGKSSLLRALQRHASNQKDMAVTYLDVYGLIKNSSNLEFPGNQDVSHIQGYIMDSNGEFILRKFGDFIKGIDSLCSSLKDNPHRCVAILADGLDDGANIPMINFFKIVLIEKFSAIKSLADECIVLLSANQYETTRNTNVIDVHTGKIIEIKSYDDFKSQIVKSYQLYVQRQSEALGIDS